LAFEGIREQLKDQWADLSSKIQENSTFNNLREKFEEQTPTVQRAIVAGAAILIALFLLSFPYGYISESQTYMEEFETNRGLIQGLLRASRAAKEPSPLPTPMASDMLKSRIEAILRENRLVPEQIGEIAALPERPAKDLAPPAVTQTGIAAQVKKLNVEQLISISHALQSLGPGIKLVGLDVIQTAGQTHYYDIVARVVSFALPQMSFEADAGGPGAKKNVRPNAGRKAPGSPEGDE
jgi:hypothetical protein